MQTSTYSAEFGKSLGGVVNIQIKSGANQVLGNVFDFERNDRFDANNFFNNRAGRAKPNYKQHQFGATLGGRSSRIGRSFFATTRGCASTRARPTSPTVPTLKMRAGDFSEAQPPDLRPSQHGHAVRGQLHSLDRIDPVAATS